MTCLLILFLHNGERKLTLLIQKIVVEVAHFLPREKMGPFSLCGLFHYLDKYFGYFQQLPVSLFATVRISKTTNFSNSLTCKNMSVDILFKKFFFFVVLCKKKVYMPRERMPFYSRCIVALGLQIAPRVKSCIFIPLLIHSILFCCDSNSHPY